MTLPHVQPTPVASPCIKICVLDQAEVCIGCGRSLKEIADWSLLQPAEQRQVCELAALRLSQRKRAGT